MFFYNKNILKHAKEDHAPWYTSLVQWVLKEHQ